MAITVPAFGARLAAADDFVELATTVCDALDELFGVPRSGIALHRDGSGPVLFVDNLGPGQDAYRLATVSAEDYRGGPIERALRSEPIGTEELAALARRCGFAGDYGHVVVLPLFAPSGLVGSIQCGCDAPFAASLRRDLETLATQVSVRLAQLRVSAVTRDAPELTSRQHEVARLAARGATNPEIATVLAISTNTVKKVLKDIFDRLGIHNRTELANELPRAAPRLDLAPGVTRRGGLVITRGD